MPDIRQKDPVPNEPAGRQEAKQQAPAIPSIALPKGGGAIRGIGEKFSINPVTGTGSISVPVFCTPSRSDFYPKLSLSFDSGAGNGPFGLGWSLAVPSISRKTDKGLPKYRDAEDSDTYLLSGAEDLVPAVGQSGIQLPALRDAILDSETYIVQRYAPRIEGLFARIERWRHKQTGDAHWRSISKDNITTVYGRTPAARIFDPADATRVFQWLIEESYDDKGNVIAYEYKQENGDNIDASQPQERNRFPIFANRYVKRIKYGNSQPNHRDGWLFEVVFDYGEHDPDNPAEDESRTWPVRMDAFSHYRSGFEIRTLRLCRRVLVFHHFVDELGPLPYLVRSTDFTYQETAALSYLTSITQTGYRPETGYKRSMPPLEFTYSQPVVDEQVHSIDASSLANLPTGLDNSSYQWVDLDNEGISGILSEQADGWFYKRNLGDAKFGRVELVATKPSGGLRSSRRQLMDVAGNGQLCLVDMAEPMPGFSTRTRDGNWDLFTPFESFPTISLDDPNVKMIDLTGDGIPDIVFSEDDRFVWYASLAHEGFDRAKTSFKPSDEEKGPALVFADATQSIYLSDMTGDGLVDIVRIRNGEVCYWPNLGYGRFAAKVTMDGAPWFDLPDQFHQNRIRLADIDGSGTTDLIYLGRSEIRFWLNQAGNSWSAPQSLTQFPRTDRLSAVNVIDLLGNGTSCIVWSSPMPGDASQPMRYIDLMSSRKPHLLVSVRNNLGVETRVEYTASTKFYLEDRLAGQPWATRLPFPVQVVERVETRDYLTGNRFVALYRYRHGFYDHDEREFRGFGMVEQTDTEQFGPGDDPLLHVPPALTRSWFHTGAYFEQEDLVAQFRKEYYHDVAAAPLADNMLPSGSMTGRERREACRGLKGSLLRSEIYSQDGLSSHPYLVSEQNYEVQMLQPVQAGRYGVFFTHPLEKVEYHYERNPLDPRVTHEMTLAVDDFGNVLQSAAIAYPHRSPAQHEQERPWITVTENTFFNNPDADDWYRLGLPVTADTYELTGAPEPAGLYAPEQIVSAMAKAELVPYEKIAPANERKKRLVESLRTIYLKNDLSGPLPLGQADRRALPYQTYKMAFTPGLLANVFGSRVDDAMLFEGGYMTLAADAHWWIPSGQPLFDDTAEPFYLPVAFRDPFGNVAHVIYDANHLLPLRTEDPLANVTEAINDYRVMAPMQVTDPNGNRTQVAFDALGLMVGTAVMGKITENLGDSLTGFSADLSEAAVIQHMTDPHADADALLHTATTRLVYDLDRYRRTRTIQSGEEHGEPVVTSTLARETHNSDLAIGEKTRIRHTFLYADGLGREIQTKVPAEPGEAPLRAASGALLMSGGQPQTGPVNPRWTGTGRVIFNNKGKPVKQYEPFFSSTHLFEDEPAMTMTGVTPVMHYDPVSRVIRTDLPNGTYSKVEFSPWHQEHWDPNDTVKDSLWISSPTTPPIAASKAAAHAGTPSVTHFDALGRVFLTIADNKLAQYETRVEFDIEGNQRSVTDALLRKVMVHDYDMLGHQIHTSSMDAGARWILNDVAGKPLRLWDSRAHRLRSEYDALRRPTHLYVYVEGTKPEMLAERTVYGETVPGASGLNLLTKPHQHYDAAGLITNEQYDFKGNSLKSNRRLAITYKEQVDWSVPDPEQLLLAETFTTVTAYDALNRPIRMTTPDRSQVSPSYNEANLLERFEARLRGAAISTTFVTNIDYNAKGQRIAIEYGNGVRTHYEYDEKTFRLTRLHTTSDAGADADVLQDLSYTYDPVGNIVAIQDDAQQIIYFSNNVVTASGEYVYDAIYRLIRATGREHLGQVGPQPAPTSYNDYSNVGLPHRSDLIAMGTYVEQYLYDAVGNFQQMIHRGTTPESPGWTRTYAYNETSLLESGNRSNRLSSTTIGALPTETYGYDAHGNMLRMPQLQIMLWDFKDQLQTTQRQAVNADDEDGVQRQGERTWYVYDSSGQRVRKVTELANGQVKDERIYLSGFEIYNKPGANPLVRETLHIMDDKRRIALVETRTQGTESSPAQLVRYQFGNHLGSASLELDGTGAVLSYEEYFPYGSTSYQRNQTGTLKRYRYAGKERDEESGLYYHGVRYYASWLCRWTSCDPLLWNSLGNAYEFCLSHPTISIDPDGRQTIRTDKNKPINQNQVIVTPSGGTDAYGQNMHEDLHEDPHSFWARTTFDSRMMWLGDKVEGLLNTHENRPNTTPVPIELGAKVIVESDPLTILFSVWRYFAEGKDWSGEPTTKTQLLIKFVAGKGAGKLSEKAGMSAIKSLEGPLVKKFGKGATEWYGEKIPGWVGEEAAKLAVDHLFHKSEDGHHTDLEQAHNTTVKPAVISLTPVSLKLLEKPLDSLSKLGKTNKAQSGSGAKSLVHTPTHPQRKSAQHSTRSGHGKAKYIQHYRHLSLPGRN